MLMGTNTGPRRCAAGRPGSGSRCGGWMGFLVAVFDERKTMSRFSTAMFLSVLGMLAALSADAVLGQGTAPIDQGRLTETSARAKDSPTNVAAADAPASHVFGAGVQGSCFDLGDVGCAVSEDCCNFFDGATCNAGTCCLPTSHGLGPNLCQDNADCCAGTCHFFDGATGSGCCFELGDVGCAVSEDCCNFFDGATCNFGTCCLTTCNDHDVCTLDLGCLSVGCRHIQLFCFNDGLLCTADTCDPVLGCNAPVDCDDHNVCTLDLPCDPTLGCRHIRSFCFDDGLLCTVNTCDPVLGCNAPVDCDDHNACTLDLACHPVFGCRYLPNLCPVDGLLCTVDTCDPVLGCNPPVDCDDHNACTADLACDPVFGCQYEPVICPDDGSPCTTESCDPSVGCISTGECGPCDIDRDGDVDRCDLNVVLSGRGQPSTGPDDPRDLDGDGWITVLDARICTKLCDTPRCSSCIP